jgi:farnesyl-diphosphate farnesyltransferase
MPPDELAALLARTSRTFALAIPLLSGAALGKAQGDGDAALRSGLRPADSPNGRDLAEAVGAAYLLFRVADTLEDATLWDRDRRAAALSSFAAWIDGAEREPRFQTLVRERAPVTDEGCLELCARADDVLEAVSAMAPGIADAIRTNVRRTALGMREFVERQDSRGGLSLRDADDLGRYCYAVAGIVGEMLTDLFTLSDEGAARVKDRLAADAAVFGEALQLVNILKDAPADAAEGRVYLPAQVPRADVVGRARDDLRRAGNYLRALEEGRAAPGIIAFCTLPARLAEATLDRLDEGAPKLSRQEVMQIYASTLADLT